MRFEFSGQQQVGGPRAEGTLARGRPVVQVNADCFQHPVHAPRPHRTLVVQLTVIAPSLLDLAISHGHAVDRGLPAADACLNIVVVGRLPGPL